jgi:ADP-L-glycero-D-manno-heptose 6-epimerase
MLAAGTPKPSYWVALDIFNACRPNEALEKSITSVVEATLDKVVAGSASRLCQSDRPDVAAGEQRRDFVWMGDMVDVQLRKSVPPEVSVWFNLGTGKARKYRLVAEVACRAPGVAPIMEFVDLPKGLRGQHQSNTQRPMTRRRSAGRPGQFSSLEENVARFTGCLWPRPQGVA